MTYRQLEMSRELRLWVTQVIVPTAATLYILLRTPEGKAIVEELKKKLSTTAKKLFAK